MRDEYVTQLFINRDQEEYEPRTSHRPSNRIPRLGPYSYSLCGG